MKINVREKHKLEGERQSCFYCPIALAVRERIPEEDITVAENGRMWTRDSKGRMRLYKLPRVACEWIRTFDHGTPEERAALKPFSFRATRQ